MLTINDLFGPVSKRHCGRAGVAQVLRHWRRNGWRPVVVRRGECWRVVTWFNVRVATWRPVGGR